MQNNKESQRCWEFWNCSEEILKKCPAFTSNSGKECWFVAGSFKPTNFKCPKLEKEFRHCWECQWFQKLNPDFDKNAKIRIDK